MSDHAPSPVNDPAIVRREYATEDRFLARRLTTWAELHGPLVEDAAIDAVAERAPARVLDVGCGTGDYSERVAREAGVNVVALDLSARMTALAHARGLRAVTGGIESLPFADASFDCVLASRVLYHVPHLDAGLAEIARTLRPGGTLVAVTYGTNHLNELWALVGTSPIAATFTAENGAALLRRRFDAVERRDVTGTARFASASAILGCLAAYGEFSDVDLRARLANAPPGLDASYRHTIFVARRRA
jgi:SAM-dependent methyltransferase